MLSIKVKAGLILLVFFILCGALSYGIQIATVYQGFLNLEYQEAQRNLFRSTKAIDNEIDRIESLCRDWAAWDDTYDFMKSRSDEYLQSNLTSTTFTNNILNFIFFYDTAGNVVWWDSYDLETEERMALVDFPKTLIQTAQPLLSYDQECSHFSVSSVLSANPFPILVSSHPILKSNFDGPIQGYLIFGRFLTPALIKEFADQSEFDFDVVPLQGDAVPTKMKEVADQITAEALHLIQADQDTYLHAYTTISDIKGRKALLVSAKIPRKIKQAGTRAMRYAMVSMFIAGVCIFFGMLFILQRVILTPVSILTGHMVSIGKTDDLSARLSFDRRDEIGVMADEFDRMLGNLEKKGQELAEANIKLEKDVTEREQLIFKLEKALSKVKTLSGLLPICSSCKKIRDDKGYWNQIESYIHKHSDAQFSHGICPDCVKKVYPELYEKIK